MRGKGLFQNDLEQYQRITPAYAGKREKKTKRNAAIKGSPPPMRGKVFRFFRVLQFLRITPAYAGKRYSRVSQSIPSWDHPRLCGEKSENGFLPLDLNGSPPPMRGKACVSDTLHQEKGITPAYAGKSR